MLNANFEQSEKPNEKDELNRQLAEGLEPESLLLNNDDYFHAFLNWEESMVKTIQSQPIIENPFIEKLDIAKALKVTEQIPVPVPQSLLNYVTLQLEKPSPKPGLVIRMYESGLSAITSLLDPSVWSQENHFVPALRTSLEPNSLDKSFVVFKEKQDQGFSFYYQVVKEKADEVFLSIKAESSTEVPFHQVTLKREGRFILSRNLEKEGQLSFSGLKAGNYTIEFQGDSFSKAVDLLLLAG